MGGKKGSTFPASAKVQGQERSRDAYAAFEDVGAHFPWWVDYQELRDAGWDWRKAVYLAWKASPVSARFPSTQMELAVDVLGLSSDRTIAKWRNKFPEMDDTITALQAAPLLRHRRDIYEALAASASNADPRSHSDRKLALEMLGDYTPKSRQELSGPDGQAIEHEHTLSADQLAMMAKTAAEFASGLSAEAAEAWDPDADS